ncbi:MAG: AAA family ATPase, partial [Clostridia bacterium]|nr:AAA family ATPase [Clostridia bacterium]
AVYLLDEPENSLSIERQIELAAYVEATARATRSQFIIATHSPVFLSMSGAKIYNLDEYPASVCKWTELENVRRYFDFFMEHRQEFES